MFSISVLARASSTVSALMRIDSSACFATPPGRRGRHQRLHDGLRLQLSLRGSWKCVVRLFGRKLGFGRHVDSVAMVAQYVDGWRVYRRIAKTCRCGHRTAPKASICNVVSELRTVNLSAGGRATNLTWSRLARDGPAPNPRNLVGQESRCFIRSTLGLLWTSLHPLIRS